MNPSIATHTRKGCRRFFSFFVPSCLILPLLSACANLQSDHDLTVQAEKIVNQMIQNDGYPENLRDSLFFEAVIDVFHKANRGAGLVNAMMDTRHYESNPTALYGMAVGYALQKNETEAMICLGKAVGAGDFHLYQSKQESAFAFLVGNPEYQILIETARTNKFKTVAQDKFEQIEPALPIDD